MSREKYVLIIDDDPGLFDGVQSCLDQEKVVLLQAFSGHAGVDIASRQVPDLILLGAWSDGVSNSWVWDELRAVLKISRVQILTLPEQPAADGDDDVGALRPRKLAETIRQALDNSEKTQLAVNWAEIIPGPS
jgi:DNA-binding response OmpR family regulator